MAKLQVKAGVLMLAMATAAGTARAAAPVPGSFDSLPRLAGTNVITTSHSAAMRVALPETAYLSLDPKRAISISGLGRLVALVLTEELSGGASSGFAPAADQLTVLRPPAQTRAGVQLSAPVASTHQVCQPGALPDPAPVGGTQCYEQVGSQGRLHRGVYQLLVVADGSPVTITLRLSNLHGSRRLEPTQQIHSTITPMAVSLDGSATGAVESVASGGAADTFPRVRRAIAFGWYDTTASSTYQNVGACFYSGSDGVSSAAGPYRWLPGCPGGSSLSFGSLRLPGQPDAFGSGPGHHAMDATADLASGLDSIGFYVASAGVKGFGGLLAVYEDPLAVG